MKKAALLLGIAALTVSATAQNVVVPQGMATSNTGVSGLTWRNTEFRFQMIYDSSHFLNQGFNAPMMISRLRFRANGGLTSPGGETYTGLTVQLSSSPLDFNDPSTSFAARRGADVRTVFSGTLICAAATGGSPNTYIIDIPLSSQFVYDPTSGLDLCIEVDAPAPIPATVPNMACSADVSSLSRRLSASTRSATSGALSYFANVVMMDCTRFPDSASSTRYGIGCVGRSQSYYETVTAGSFDLQGTPSTVNSLSMTPYAGGYRVAQGSNNWFTPISAPIPLTDDSLSAILPLGFTFNHPTGSTTGIKICSNGFIWLDTTRTESTFAGTPALLLSQGARLAPLWHDMDPGVGGTIQFDIDPNLNTAYATWTAVPQYGLPALLTTMQVALSSDGSIEYRWMDCANGDGIVGWSPGGAARDPGNRDISATIPFVTQPDSYPLALDARDRPRLGTTQQFSISQIPQTATLGALALGVTQHDPGFELSSIGMPTCFLNCSFEFSLGFGATGSIQSIDLPIPIDPNLAGLHLYAQGISTSLGANLLGMITSNGLDLLLNPN